LAESHRLDMSAAQSQPTHLVDDKAAERGIPSAQESPTGFQMLKREVIRGVAAGVVRGTRVRRCQQRIDGGPVCVVQIPAILAKPSSGDGLNDPVHLDQVTGTVDFRECQPVELTGGSAEAQR
jgi:hypothetical protein